MPDTAPPPPNRDTAIGTSVLALSGGDPAGIGLDIAISAWLARTTAAVPAFVIYTDAAALEARSGMLGTPIPIVRIKGAVEAHAYFPSALPVIDIPAAAPVIPGRPDLANGACVIAAIEAATAAVARCEAAALVTNPIAKHVLYGAGFTHPGHTEFLAELAERHFPGGRYRSVMLLAAAELRVVPLTVHVPLTAVPGLVTQAGIIETARILDTALRIDFGFPRPRIAVAGLNPHAGENGTMGREDIEIIAPAIAQLRTEGLLVTGPYSADTLFHAQAREGYDAVIAMYHDQALIPLKTLAFDRGVNITLGLPFVRTSPDHGTAFDIAGRGKASPTSLIEALRSANRMVASRQAVSAR